MQLTTSRSDFSGELALEKKILRHSLSFAVILTATHSHICPLHLLLLLHTHTFPSLFLLVTPLSPFHHPSFSPLVSNTDKRYSMVSGDTISSPVPEQGWKLVAGVPRQRAIDLYLKAIMVLCIEEVTIGISVKAAWAPTPTCSYDVAWTNFPCSWLCAHTS